MAVSRVSYVSKTVYLLLIKLLDDDKDANDDKSDDGKQGEMKTHATQTFFSTCIYIFTPHYGDTGLSFLQGFRGFVTEIYMYM